MVVAAAATIVASAGRLAAMVMFSVDLTLPVRLDTLIVSVPVNTFGLIPAARLPLASSRHPCRKKPAVLRRLPLLSGLNDPARVITVTEFLILQALATRPGHVKSRDQLMDAAYGENIYVDDRTIDSHIKRLRKKFKDTDPEFSQIDTLYGIGYRYKEGA